MDSLKIRQLFQFKRAFICQEYKLFYISIFHLQYCNFFNSSIAVFSSDTISCFIICLHVVTKAEVDLISYEKIKCKEEASSFVYQYRHSKEHNIENNGDDPESGKWGYLDIP